jgi:hypothetical protein
MDGGTLAERDGVDVDELLRGTVGIMWGGSADDHTPSCSNYYYGSL